MLSIADQNDAIRNIRPGKPAFDAAKMYAILTDGDGRGELKHMDPLPLTAFKATAKEFEAIPRNSLGIPGANSVH